MTSSYPFTNAREDDFFRSPNFTIYARLNYFQEGLANKYDANAFGNGSSKSTYEGIDALSNNEKQEYSDFMKFDFEGSNKIISNKEKNDDIDSLFGGNTKQNCFKEPINKDGK